MRPDEIKRLGRAMEDKGFRLSRCIYCGTLVGSGWQSRREYIVEYAAHALRCAGRLRARTAE